MSETPIFIFTYNRLTVLQEAIQSFKRLNGSSTIVIHDTGSTYQPLLSYLDTIEADGAVVYRNRPHVDAPEKLNAIADTIEDYFSTRAASYYAVTDADVAFSDECPDDVLSLYRDVLDAHPEVDSVGPMLRIDDLPDAYPLKDAVIWRHTNQFYQKTPEVLRWSGRDVQYQHTYIDTTFGLYRPGFRYKRLCDAIRVYGPYWARHLDWYLDPANLTEDQALYLAQSTDVSHWGGAWLRDAVKPDFDTDTYAFKV